MITVAQVKQELGVTSSVYDALIEALIESVIAIFEQLTNKVWSEQTTKETFETLVGNCIYLKAENVSLVYSIASGADSALVIYGQNPANVPTVTINSTTLILVDADGETELTFADNTTLSDMVEAINAVDGWTSFAYPGHNITLSKNLLEVVGNFCDSNGTDFYVPDEFVSEVKFNKTLKSLKIPSNFAGPFVVTYKCGYTTSNAPAWLKQILIRQVCHWYTQAVEKRWHVSGITLGEGGTISYGEQKGNLLSDFVNAAQKHKRINI